MLFKNIYIALIRYFTNSEMLTAFSKNPHLWKCWHLPPKQNSFRSTGAGPKLKLSVLVRAQRVTRGPGREEPPSSTIWAVRLAGKPARPLWESTVGTTGPLRKLSLVALTEGHCTLQYPMSCRRLGHLNELDGLFWTKKPKRILWILILKEMDRFLETFDPRRNGKPNSPRTIKLIQSQIMLKIPINVNLTD